MDGETVRTERLEVKLTVFENVLTDKVIGAGTSPVLLEEGTLKAMSRDEAAFEIVRREAHAKLDFLLVELRGTVKRRYGVHDEASDSPEVGNGRTGESD